VIFLSPIFELVPWVVCTNWFVAGDLAIVVHCKHTSVKRYCGCRSVSQARLKSRTFSLRFYARLKDVTVDRSSAERSRVAYRRAGAHCACARFVTHFGLVAFSSLEGANADNHEHDLLLDSAKSCIVFEDSCGVLVSSKSVVLDCRQTSVVLSIGSLTHGWAGRHLVMKGR
jgi:hypothetical protein